MLTLSCHLLAAALPEAALSVAAGRSSFDTASTYLSAASIAGKQIQVKCVLTN